MAKELIEVDTQGWEHDNLEAWFNSLSVREIIAWIKIIKKTELSEEEQHVLFETAALIYCKEMGIGEIPRSLEFAQTIVNNFATKLLLLQLRKEEYITTQGDLNMTDVTTTYRATEKGMTFASDVLKREEPISGDTLTHL